MKRQEIDKLVNAALAARKNAFCPLTGYAVGAAVMGVSGKIYGGCNIESKTGILHTCAERAAIFCAVSQGERAIIAVSTASAGSFPCGFCRQAICEFGGPDTPVFSVMAGKPGSKPTVAKTTLRKLLPGAHTSKTIERYAK